MSLFWQSRVNHQAAAIVESAAVLANVGRTPPQAQT